MRKLLYPRKGILYLLPPVIFAMLIFIFTVAAEKIVWFLFLLNIPMGRMIWLKIKTNSGFTYSGYVIYLSARYTFYTMGMSVLGLQTAMITWFSANGENYRKRMYTLTGIFVYGAVVFIAIYMIIKVSIHRKRVVTGE